MTTVLGRMRPVPFRGVGVGRVRGGNGMVSSRPIPIMTRAATRLRDDGPATVSGISRALQVSRTSIENVLGVLVESGIVTCTTVNRAGVGRPSRTYEFDASRGYVAGVDVGNASVRVVIVNSGGDVLAHCVGEGVESSPDGASKLQTVVKQVRLAVHSASIPGDRLRAIGLALPGTVNESGLVLNSVVIPEWSGVDIAGQFRREFETSVAVDNGVRLAAVAEHHLGAAQLVSDVLYLSVGNRIAMGLILDGAPRRGAHDLAGDVGRLAFPGVRADTGQISWSSGVNAAEVFALARSGDPSAQDEIAVFVERLGRALSTLIMAVDPAKVVVGGGLSEAHEEFLEPLRGSVADCLRIPLEIPIVEGRMGEDAAVHGAVVLAFQKHGHEIYGLEGMTVPRVSALRF